MGGRGAGKSVILVDRKEVEKKLDEVTRIHVKLRDCYLPCISCGASWSPEFEAGHFHTRGAHPKLKFNIKNIHAQCKKCNGSESGNKVGFKKGIAERYGAQALRELEKLPLTDQTKTNWEMCEDIKILSELNKQLRESIKT